MKNGLKLKKINLEKRKANDLSFVHWVKRRVVWRGSTVVRRVKANDVSFACWIKRLVVRACRTTCRSDKEETTCRFLLPDDLSFECGWTVFFGDKNDVVLDGNF